MMLRSLASRLEGTRRGMVAAQVAVSFTALLGVTALLVDGGLVLSERRHAQATADAAAMAAASDLYANWNSNAGVDNGSAKSSALSVAASNGYANDGTNSTVTINIPPLAGNFIGKAGFVEAIVTWNQKRGFSRIYSTATIPVSAGPSRGVCHRPGTGPGPQSCRESSCSTRPEQPCAVLETGRSMSPTPKDTQVVAARFSSIPRDPTPFRCREMPT